MSIRVLSSRFRHLLAFAFAVAAIAAVVRAQSGDFYAKRTALRNQAKSDQQQAGLAGPGSAKSLFSQFPTPEIALAAPIVIKPGQSAPLQLSGKFNERTTFLSGSSALTLSNASVGANTFSATAQAPADSAPQWVRIYAFAPVSAAETWTPVFVGSTPPAYTLTAKNGWTVKLVPDAPTFAITARDASVGYRAEYYKPGETKPFETLSGSLRLDANSSGAGLQFSMQPGGQGSAMAELEQLSNRMAELMKAGKFEGKEMAALQKKMEAVQDRLTKEMQAQVADPAAMQRKQDEFGCGTIFLEPKGGTVTGNVSCGKNVGSLQLTGGLGQ